jgi:hypothetical protein
LFLPASTFSNRCAVPRSGIDPATNLPVSDIQGSVSDENNFLRSYSNDTYLWYDEITDRNPNLYDDPLFYFDLLKTEERTASGRLKDEFHFTVPTDEWYAISEAGESVGYGVTFVILADEPPREVVVAFSEAGTPADLAGLERGALILSVDGVDIDDETDSGIDVLNAGLYPGDSGESHEFEILDFGASVSRTIEMTSTGITHSTVRNVQVLSTPTGEVGYLQFNDHSAPAEDALIDAVEQLNAGAGIDDLVIDLRYNGGGYLDIASEFAYMIAGPDRTDDLAFETLQFNDKHPTINPVTGETLSPIPFHSTAQGFSATLGTPLPTLDLARVFVLTGPDTCSASESIINSLRGIGVDVIQIGSTSCGKPYGFYATDNCGTTYFTIQFQGVNAVDFGDYAEGFSPENTVENPGALVPGCSVLDDFSAPLGDPAEARLAAALEYREVPGTCPVASGRPAVGVTGAGRNLSAVDGVVQKDPWLTNRILR